MVALKAIVHVASLRLKLDYNLGKCLSISEMTTSSKLQFLIIALNAT